MINKLLLQWLPDPPLRAIESFRRGAKGANEIHQTAVHLRDPQFAAAFLRANRWLEGLPIVQIGFDCTVRATDTGWKPNGPVPPEALWSHVPSVDELLAMDERLNPTRNPAEATLAALQATVAAAIVDEDKKVQDSAAELRAAVQAHAEHPDDVQTALIRKTGDPVLEKAVSYDLPVEALPVPVPETAS